MLRRLLTAAALAATTLPAAVVPAEAQQVQGTEFATGRFVAEHEAVAPGEATAVALDMTIQPGWHTYWRNAGDSGQPIEVSLTVPEGVTTGETLWPAPRRQPYPPLMNYGYEDAATLLFPLSVPAGWPAGEPVRVKADVTWLVCKEVCIPEFGEATFDVPTGERTVAAPAAVDLFRQARADAATPSPYPARFAVADGALRLRVDADAFAQGRVQDAYFFPGEWGVIDHAAEQERSIDADGLTLTIPLSADSDEPPADEIEGVLAVIEDGAGAPVRLDMRLTAGEGAVSATAVAGAARAPPGAVDGAPLGVVLGLAFVGGLILNLMPCVFPVLALKALGFARGADQPFGARAGHALAYALGVLVFFVGLAGILLALRAGGEAVGWGFQLQNPWVVAALAALMLLIGLNLSGVFEVSSRLAGVGSGAAEAGGMRGAFATGALTALVATPCTAPFMGTAMGATLSMPPAQALLVFGAMGLGLAAPFLLLSLVPAAARLLPRPGPWMVRLKEVLAFPMYATAALLVWVLGSLAGRDAMLAAMIGGVLLGLGAWALGWRQRGGGRGSLVTGGVAAALAALLAVQVATSRSGAEAPGEPFSAARLAELRASGEPVFLNLTADWCITCKVNERVALRDRFEAALAANGVTYLLGDWTRPDPEITALLEGFGRTGVPLYVVYPRDGEPVVLPQVLTPGMLEEALGRA